VPASTAAPTAIPPEPTPRFIEITTPLVAGERYVKGTAQPLETLSLKDNGVSRGSTVVQADGFFAFDLEYAGLIAGHLMEVEGYGMSDSAIVVVDSTPTPTPTASPTPTWTPTPGGTDIQIEPLCGPEGSNTVTVYGYDWPEADVSIQHIFAGDVVQEWSLAKGEFDINFTVDITIDTILQGEHTIQALYYSPPDGLYVIGDAEPFVVPCATPVPTPRPPNLIIESITLLNDGPIATCLPLTFVVSIANVGETTASNLFWADLFVDPTDPIVPTNPQFDETDYWVAVNSLDAGVSTSLTLYLLDGVDTTGEHTAYVMVDTLNGVAEFDELDNVGDPLTFSALEDQCAPTPTPMPTSEPALAGDGAISGSTWLHLNGDVAPQGRVNVYWYDGDVLVAETVSDRDGNYLQPDLPPGTYTVIGESVIDGVLYTDIAWNIIVKSGETTPYVTLYMH
jgi:hypothetical protein